MQIKDYIQIKDNIGHLTIKLTPKANKNEFFSVLENGVLKIRISAVPENGKANKKLIKFLASEIGIDKKNIEIVSGKTEQLKKIRIKINS